MAIVVACGPKNATTAAGKSDVATSWSKAVVYVPGQAETFVPSGVNETSPRPVVVYLHGCSGISPHNDIQWGKFLRSIGFIVVQPDSLARRDRSRSCDANTAAHMDPSVHPLRLEEAAYALEQLQHAKWADSRNVFLMGHSEGAIAAARTTLSGWRGVIVSSWLCTEPRNKAFDGLFMPRETPVLTMGFDQDPWYYGTRWHGSCADKFDGRTNAKNITWVGRQHTTFNEEARAEVETFLKSNMTGRPAN